MCATVQHRGRDLLLFAAHLTVASNKQNKMKTLRPQTPTTTTTNTRKQKLAAISPTPTRKNSLSPTNSIAKRRDSVSIVSMINNLKAMSPARDHSASFATLSMDDGLTVDDDDHLHALPLSGAALNISQFETGIKLL